MKKLLNDYMILLLAEHDNKLAEILGILSLIQCSIFWFIPILFFNVRTIKKRLWKLEMKAETENEL